MKIALVIENMDTSRGGRETSTAQIAVELAGRGHDVTIICQAGDSPGAGVAIHALGKRGLFRSRRMAKFVAGASLAVEADSYDVVHAMLPLPGADVYQPRGGTIRGQIAARQRRWGAMGKIRTSLLGKVNRQRALLGSLERQVIADPSVRCLALSDMVAREFADHYGRRDGVQTIYNAADLPQCDPDDWAHWRQELRYRMGIGQGDTVFISIATNFSLKGMDHTIRAFARWCHSSVPSKEARLIVVGREVVEGYQRLAAMRDVGNKVLFIPPTNEIMRYYAAADVCILLSWYDPCSRTVLEATRLGIPSITTAYNGAAEILSGGAGITVSSPKDTKAILAAFDELPGRLDARSSRPVRRTRRGHRDRCDPQVLLRPGGEAPDCSRATVRH